MTESLRILILEDNSADAELVQFELQEAGIIFTAKVVKTENAYVQAIQDYCPDLILSDYDLPTYNGALALAEARRRCPDTPFILVTGAVTEDRAIEILTQGAKDYVLKTRLQQRLVPAIRRALAEAEEQKARKNAEEELREAHNNLERQVAERTADLQKEIEHRYRVEQSLLRYSEQIELLSHTSSRLLVSDKPQQLVEELCLKVMEFLDCDAFFNFLVDEAAGCLHLNACAGIPKETMREIEWLDYGVAVCGCAARDACRIVAENIPMTPDMRTELVKSFGIKAYACHPLMGQNRVLGTLSFGTRSRTTFSADDLAIMKAIADQVAIAMSRIKTEDTLRESEERLKNLYQESPIPTFTWQKKGEDFILVDANRAAIQLTKDKAGEFLGRSAMELYKDRPQVLSDMNRCYDERSSVRREIISQNLAPGRFFSVHYGFIPPDLIIVHMDDQTERKRSEEAVIRSQKTFYELIERSPFGTYVVDSQFRIAQMNAASQTGAFRNVRPVIGRDFAEAMHILWPEPVAEEIIAAFRRTLDTGESYYSPRFTNPRHDVAVVESYEWELHRMTLPDGQYGVICYYFDSTRLREADRGRTESARFD